MLAFRDDRGNTQAHFTLNHRPRSAYTASKAWEGRAVGSPAFRSLIELELWGKNERASHDETKTMVSIFKTLGQLWTSEVRSATSNSHMAFRD